jgi:hypothetical protein
MIRLREAYWVREGELRGLGITRYMVRRAVEEKRLKKVVLPGQKYGRLRRADVLRVFRVRVTEKT